MERFPTIIATGSAFCNRVNQRKLLKTHIENGVHTVLMGPRRYGKTSLVNQVLIEGKYSYCMMELLLVSSAGDLEQLILDKASELISKLIPKSLKARQAILKMFQFLNPEIVLSAAGQKIVFHPAQSDKPIVRISEILNQLEAVAKKVKKRVVVVMDEFQEIHSMEGHKVEAAIRHSMQYSQHVTYVFLGSNRRLLENMFNDKNRPFYQSCEVLKLGRISSEDYIPFIQKAAKSKWGKHLEDKVVNEILRLTENHPSYVNRLCRYFWLTDRKPDVSMLKKYWTRYVLSRRQDFSEDFSSLSQNQKKLLVYLARNRVEKPSGQAAAYALEAPEASVRQALRELVAKDFVFKDQEGIWQILDPAMGWFLRETKR